ncbi:Predicted glycosyl transferase [Georgenia satyanarayanai]|uniref:Predicted glycosyl transferase n=1 Tax=Georgenia satyanarayanai TaxID=860221 RepID=A0A2Y9C4M3_9MICO|nr:glycosyltransferase [Georgenia satyanarayanai]PYG00468.1 putative glycosyltransferase [Georgenia satyanarayanai]SSA39853.1 Predicted glycosyl transferase [Georgenia satyanarayanai]
MTTTTTRPAGPAGPHRGTDPQGRRLRVALYSHDALGLGHVRRNLAIARALTTLGPAPDVLLLTGAPEAVTAQRPAHCDLVSLPALAKDATGAYSARHLSVDEAHIRHMRRAVLTAALSSFRPDVLVVDKHPRGFLGELEPALALLRAAGTRIVLGLRDVLDDAVTSRREWDADRGAQALRRWYDQVWVYGDRAVHDLTAELDLPAARTVHTGYLATGRQGGPAVTEVDNPYVLAMVGGGSDGAHLAEAFVRTTMPAGHHGVLVTGPQMPADDVRRVTEIAAHRTDLTVRTFVEDAEALIGGAAAVVSMGGYNTVCEALALGVRLLVVPRVRPRQEQLVRARLLTAVGVLDHLPPERLTSPALERWLARAVTAQPDAPEDVVDLGGLTRLPHLLTSLVATKEETDVA